MKYYENELSKIVFSENYNCVFYKKSGKMLRWGKDRNDDPERAPHPEILDIEVSTICHGIPVIGANKPTVCKHCYHSNTSCGQLMDLETFKQIMNKMDLRYLQQIALGIGDINTPNIIPILEYTRSLGVIPNLTTNGYFLTKDLAQKFASLVGGLAVSRYDNKDICYDAIKMFVDSGIKQTNMHFMLAEETYEQAIETLYDIKNDPRLKDLNAIVFLMLKKKGYAVKGFNQISPEKYKKVIDLAFELGVLFGQDTCAKDRLIDYIKEYKPEQLDMLINSIEGCCAGSFSSYISVDGKYYPCSFMEHEGEWQDGFSVLNSNSFYEIWNHQKTKDFGCQAKKCKGCQHYDI